MAPHSTQRDSQENRRTGRSRLFWAGSALIAVFAVVLLLNSKLGSGLQRSMELKAAETLGEVVGGVMEERSNKFAPVPDAAVQVADNIYRIGGVAHSQLVVTTAGNVVFDTGLSLQSAKQMRLLKESAPGKTSFIVLSHSHADHVGGTRLWMEEGARIIAHSEFLEEQRYLTELQPYLTGRNRVMFPWIPREPPTLDLLRYGGIDPDVLVEPGRPHHFELGGTRFEVIATPGGAEGADNLVMWLPQQATLFTGDTLGPMFPQFPNVVTLRGEKIRKPVEYIKTLNLLIDLEPEVLIPSHGVVVRGKEKIQKGLVRIRDAVQYVHDATVAGMNEGKTLHQLMAEITLPPELALTQSHGKISWAVKSLWEYYASWFHFESTTELYPISVRQLYPELAAVAGVGPLIEEATQKLDNNEPVEALHFIEIALAADPANNRALGVRLSALKDLLAQAENGDRVDYEMYYLKRRIEITEEALQAVTD